MPKPVPLLGIWQSASNQHIRVAVVESFSDDVDDLRHFDETYWITLAPADRVAEADTIGEEVARTEWERLVERYQLQRIGPLP